MNYMILSLISAFLLVQSASAKMTRLRHAHQHGSAKLGLAFDDKSGRLDFKVSASSIIGFEHEPKNGREKKLIEMQYSLFEAKITDIVSFAPELGCAFSKEKLLLEKDAEGDKKSKAEHRDFVAVFNIKCEKSPLGSKIVFNFQKYFPNIHDIDAAVIAGDLQKSIEIKSSGAALELTK